MSEIYAITLASLHQDMGQVDRIAQNLANTGTPGYKREVAAARPFADALAGMAATKAAAKDGAPAAGALQVRVDPAAGTLRMTGQPLDLALQGEGYFEVATDDGPAYTRQGSFHLDAGGRLVTADGHAVMGTNGEIRLTTRTPAVDAAGRITEPDATSGPSALGPGTSVAQLKIVRFEGGAQLRHLGSGLLAVPGPVQPLSDARTTVHQGALENSNVNSMQEMVQLIQTMRHFESVQRIIQGYDELLTTSIRKLGDIA